MSFSFEETVERSAEWPLPPGAYDQVPVRRRRGRRVWRRLRLLVARRAPIVVGALAVVCTAALTAAVFVGMWTREASKRKEVEAALSDAQKQLAGTADRTRALRVERARLEKALTAAQARVVRAEKSVRVLHAPVAALAAEAQSVVAELRDSGLEQRGADVSALAKRLGSVTGTLSSYLETTSAAEYDPGFVRVQLTYLADAIEKLQSSAGSLAVTAADKQQLAGNLQARAQRVAAVLEQAQPAKKKKKTKR